MPLRTIFFLILLRLAIGWHFFFEGWHKYHSTSVGTTETSRPFSSEGYFRNANGPLAPYARAQIGGDPDEAALARLTPKPIPDGKNISDVKPEDRLPDVLSQEIDGYTKRFLESFKLDDAAKKKAEEVAEKAKASVGRFLTNSVAGGQHVTEYRAKLAELRRQTEERRPTLGRDLENTRLTSLKAQVAQARKESLDELDSQLGKDLRDELNAVVKKKIDPSDPASLPKGEDPYSYLVPVSGDKAKHYPYEARWDGYLEAFEATYPLSESQQKVAGSKLATATELTADWVTARQASEPLALMLELGSGETTPFQVAAHAVGTREALARDVQENLVKPGGSENEQMKRYLNAALTDDQAKGAPPTVKAEPSEFLRRIDKATMWGLMIMGACLLLGFLTRTSCVLAAGFLAMTFLLYPPFPWLPQPPNNEGTYLFVNKNLVEMLALLVLATTASGRWFGLDALVHRLFHREKPPAKPVRSSAVRAA